MTTVVASVCEFLMPNKIRVRCAVVARSAKQARGECDTCVNASG
jgi:hypothetical protein